MCQVHAWQAFLRFRTILDAHDAPEPPTARDPIVYYLMVGPSTVKIGTTKHLPRRLAALRTDAQYVVAVEPGDFTVEHQRHQQFAAERIGRREDFRLSDRLRQHIEDLQPNRDELVEMAARR